MYVYICMYVCLCMCVCMYVCMYVLCIMCVCIPIPKHSTQIRKYNNNSVMNSFNWPENIAVFSRPVPYPTLQIPS